MTTQTLESKSGDFLAQLNAGAARLEAQYAEDHGDEELAQAGIVGVDFRDFIANEPPPFDWIVENVVAKGFKGDLCAKSKQGKSFFGMQLALCVASGRDFLGVRVPTARHPLPMSETDISRRTVPFQPSRKPQKGTKTLYIAPTPFSLALPHANMHAQQRRKRHDET